MPFYAMPERPTGSPRDGASGERTNGGAAVSFEELWQYRALLRSVARGLVADDAAADDLVQEAYARALGNLDRIDRSRSPRGYLVATVRRAAVDELRRRSRQAVPVEQLPETHSPDDPLRDLETRSALDALTQAMEALTARERQALALELDGVGAGRGHRPPFDDATRSATYRARQKLARALDRHATHSDHHKLRPVVRDESAGHP